MPPNHAYHMRMALEQARRAAALDEVPVGAVLVSAEGAVLARECNRTIGLADPTAHAEILVLRTAAGILGNYRLLSTTLYVTVEPCIMCMGAIIHARVARVVFGTPDLKWGAAGSLYDFGRDARLNHQPEIIAGVEQEACRSQMQEFFRAKRRLAKTATPEP